MHTSQEMPVISKIHSLNSANIYLLITCYVLNTGDSNLNMPKHEKCVWNVRKPPSASTWRLHREKYKCQHTREEQCRLLATGLVTWCCLSQDKGRRDGMGQRCVNCDTSHSSQCLYPSAPWPSVHPSPTPTCFHAAMAQSTTVGSYLICSSFSFVFC